MDMKTIRWLLLVITLLLVAGCGAGGKGGQGLILYQVLDQEGREPQPKLIVVDPSGKERHQIHLSAPPRVGAIFPMMSNHRALVITTDDNLYLVHAEKGTAQKLDLPEGAGGRVSPITFQFVFSDGGDRWTLLGDPQMSMAFLVSLETGEVHDLTSLVGGHGMVLSATFAPGEEHLFVLADSGLWLVPTADPGKARLLGEEEYLYSFSSDGRSVAYGGRANDGEWRVVVERVDGSRSDVVVTGGFIDRLAFVPNQEQLLLVWEDRLSLLSLKDGTEQDLLACSGRSLPLRFAPGGRKVLFGHREDEETFWHILDLKAGTEQPLDDLTDYAPVYYDTAHRWLFFVDDYEFGPGRRFKSLDLETGETHTVGWDEQAYYMGLRIFSSDGKFCLNVSTGEEPIMKLWLLRADSGEVRLLEQAMSIRAAISPDGSRVAVSTIKRTDDGSVSELVLIGTEGEETLSLGEGIAPVWVLP
jgi:hypothetical protein